MGRKAIISYCESGNEFFNRGEIDACMCLWEGLTCIIKYNSEICVQVR